MTLVQKAVEFAMRAHQHQKRKYTGEPYYKHLAEVAAFVAATPGYSESCIATAWLHDCVEDCSVDYQTLHMTFNPVVAEGVMLLSDVETGNRAERKALSRQRLHNAPAWVQNIKVADLISNTASIVENDAKFARVYLEEKRLLLDVMTKAHPWLVEIANRQITSVKEEA